jgi:hypothetical protein
MSQLPDDYANKLHLPSQGHINMMRINMSMVAPRILYELKANFVFFFIKNIQYSSTTAVYTWIMVLNLVVAVGVRRFALSGKLLCVHTLDLCYTRYRVCV